MTMISSDVIGTDRDHDLSQTDALIMKLFAALLDYHYGVNTTRPFAETYERDEKVLGLVKQYFHDRPELWAPKALIVTKLPHISN